MKRKLFGLFNGLTGLFVLYATFNRLYQSQFPKRYPFQRFDPDELYSMDFDKGFFYGLVIGFIFIIGTYYVFKSTRLVKFILGTTIASIGIITMMMITAPEFYELAIVQSRRLELEFYVGIAINLLVIYFGIKFIRSSKK